MASPAQTLALTVASWLGFSGAGRALSEGFGAVNSVPSAPLLGGLSAANSDIALQHSTVWLCVEKRASIIASLPIITYTRTSPREVATTARLYTLLHDSPNSRMTPSEFWRAMMINYDLRGNAYARIVRNPADEEALALWPMPSDQVEEVIDPVGEVWYHYTMGGVVFVFPARDVLHLKNLGNGTSGLKKLEFMRPTLTEAAGQSQQGVRTFANGGKPSAVLMTNQVLKKEQRQALSERFSEMASGSEQRLFVLEADMKYQQLTATPEQLQLMDARRFTATEICRWFDVPPVMVYHTADTTVWGTGISEIITGWYKTTLNPLCQALEQSIVKTVLTPAQRVRFDVKFNLDALLRGSPKDRFDLYASATQNGILTRDEARELEDRPAMGGNAAKLTVQSALTTIDKLGEQQQQGGANGGKADTAANVAQ